VELHPPVHLPSRRQPVATGAPDRDQAHLDERTGPVSGIAWPDGGVV